MMEGTEHGEYARMFFAGYTAALQRYAVWNDGQRLIGIMRRPLGEVLQKMHTDSDVLADLRVALYEQDNSDD